MPKTRNNQFTGQYACLTRQPVKHPIQVSETDFVDLANNVSKMALKVFIHMATKNDGWMFSIPSISKHTRMTERTVSKAKVELIQKGYLYISHSVDKEDLVYLGKRVVTAKLKRANSHAGA